MESKKLKEDIIKGEKIKIDLIWLSFKYYAFHVIMLYTIVIFEKRFNIELNIVVAGCNCYLLFSFAYLLHGLFTYNVYKMRTVWISLLFNTIVYVNVIIIGAKLSSTTSLIFLILLTSTIMFLRKLKNRMKSACGIFKFVYYKKFQSTSLELYEKFENFNKFFAVYNYILVNFCGKIFYYTQFIDTHDILVSIVYEFYVILLCYLCIYFNSLKWYSFLVPNLIAYLYSEIWMIINCDPFEAYVFLTYFSFKITSVYTYLIFKVDLVKLKMYFE